MQYFGFIYKWSDSINGKTYTGSHVGSIDDGYVGSGKLFVNAYRKRSNKFSREILEYVYDKKLLLETEQKYLNLINWSNTYNLSTIAGGGNTIINYNEKQLEEFKQKISDARKGHVVSSETKQKMRKRRSDKARKNMRYPKSEEHKQNMRGKIPWNKGKTQSAEHNQRISESQKGIPWTIARRVAQEKRNSR